jgi:molybdenum cofactor cytidylyltransferase
MSEKGTIAVVILAAGNSSRMGKPKQLLPVGGKPLLQRPIDAARNISNAKEAISSAVSVFVVLGANSEEIRQAVDFDRCQLLENTGWPEGMSTSIVVALKCIQEQLPETIAVLLVMGDQPWVTESHLAKIIAKHESTGLPVVVSQFCAKGSDEKIPGPPALFARELFADLLKLEGDAGARAVVMANAARMATVDFPLGTIDIDTETDYASLLAAMSTSNT